MILPQGRLPGLQGAEAAEEADLADRRRQQQHQREEEVVVSLGAVMIWYPISIYTMSPFDCYKPPCLSIANRK